MLREKPLVQAECRDDIRSDADGILGTCGKLVYWTGNRQKQNFLAKMGSLYRAGGKKQRLMEAD